MVVFLPYQIHLDAECNIGRQARPIRIGAVPTEGLIASVDTQIKVWFDSIAADCGLDTFMTRKTGQN
jgi:hypothetical protein